MERDITWLKIKVLTNNFSKNLSFLKIKIKITEKIFKN